MTSARRRDNNLAEYAAFTRENRSVRELGSAAITLARGGGGTPRRLLGARAWDRGMWPRGLLLVEEAGGRVTDLAGSTRSTSRLPAVVASNGRIHEAMLATLASVRGR